MSTPSIPELLSFHYECLQGMLFSEYQRVPSGALLFSQRIADPYYNFFAPETELANPAIPRDIINEFSLRGKQPALYLTPLVLDTWKKVIALETAEIWAQGVWLVGEAKSPHFGLRNRNIQVITVGPERQEEYVATFTKAYSGEGPDDPYGQLDMAYSESLKASFECSPSEYRKYYLLAEMEGRPVGVAALFIKGKIAGIYGVGTIPSERNKGIGAALMNQLAHIAEIDGCTHTMLQTEAGSWVQNWYEKLGYRVAFNDAYVLLS